MRSAKTRSGSGTPMAPRYRAAGWGRSLRVPRGCCVFRAPGIRGGLHARSFRSLAVGLFALLLPAPAASAAQHKAPPKPKPVKGILLSLGDSYSVGWQELPGGTQGPTHNGPADQLVPLAAA